MPQVASAAIDCSSNGDNVLVAAKVGYAIRVLGYVLMANGAVNAKFTDGAAGSELTGPFPLAAQAGAVAPLGPLTPTGREGWFSTSAGNALVLNLSTGVQISGHLKYLYDPV